VAFKLALEKNGERRREWCEGGKEKGERRRPKP